MEISCAVANWVSLQIYIEGAGQFFLIFIFPKVGKRKCCYANQQVARFLFIFFWKRQKFSLRIRRLERPVT